jgi:hypothetical protein
MSIDDRIRRGLRQNALSTAPQVELALASTLARARRQERRLWVGLSGATVLAVAAVVGLVATLPPAQPWPPVPAQTVPVLGSWSTQVSPGTPAVDDAWLPGTWTLTFVAEGAVNATPPGAYRGSLAGATYAIQADADGTLLSTDLFAPDTCRGDGSGSYRVVRTADGLRLQVVSDLCAPRAALLAGDLWRPARPGASCVNDGGGSCLGDLAAGSYRTRDFQPTVHYTVPAGWTNSQDLTGNLLFQPAGEDERFVGIYRNVTVPDGCVERAAPGIGTSVERIAAWLQGHPGLDAGPAEPVTVGGIAGLRIDVSLSAAWRGTCPYSTGRPIVPILFGAGPSAFHHTLLPGFHERLYLLGLPDGDGGGNVVIEVGPEGRSLDELVDMAGPLLTHLEFEGGG